MSTNEPAGPPSPGGGPEEPGRFARATGRVRVEQKRLTGKVEQTRRQLEDARPRSPFVDATFRAVEHDNSTGGVVLAGAVAFRIFLYLVPLVFVFVVGVGYAADAASSNPSDVARQTGVSGLVAQAVSGADDLSGTKRVTTLVVGVLALFLAARGLLKVLRVIHAMVWGVRPAKAIGLTKQALVLIALTIVALAAAGVLGRVRRDSFVWGLVGLFLSALVPFLVWLFASWHLPRRATRWQELVPGAVVFALGVLILHAITVYWIAREVAHKTATYGAIGTALALLLWAYLLGRVVTASAVVNASLYQRREEQRTVRKTAARADPVAGSRGEAGGEAGGAARRSPGSNRESGHDADG